MNLRLIQACYLTPFYLINPHVNVFHKIKICYCLQFIKFILYFRNQISQNISVNQN